MNKCLYGISPESWYYVGYKPMWVYHNKNVPNPQFPMQYYNMQFLSLSMPTTEFRHSTMLEKLDGELMSQCMSIPMSAVFYMTLYSPLSTWMWCYMRRFNQILAAKSFTHLRAVFEEYSKVCRLIKLNIFTCWTDVWIGIIGLQVWHWGVHFSWDVGRFEGRDANHWYAVWVLVPWCSQ